VKKVFIYMMKRISSSALGVEVFFSLRQTRLGSILDQASDIKVRTGLDCAPAAHKTLGTYPLGTVRLSPGYFNTVEEIDLTLHALGKIARAGKLSHHSRRGMVSYVLK